jgi:predicted RNA binding protein YcfA (HicA-like mRNA interferase family)/CYTH domain-containing protein
MSDKPKKYFSAMREGVAEKLAQRQQELRKKSGLPHPDYYKELGKSYDIKDDSERMAHQSSLKKKYGVKEEVEMLDEMPESSMKTRDVHAHLKKSGWSLARTGGGHDVYSHPKSKQHIAVPRHKQLKAPLIRGIMKASRVSEEIEIDEQHVEKGRFRPTVPHHVSSVPTASPRTSSDSANVKLRENGMKKSNLKEAKDPREYDYEGDMAMSQLRSLVFNAEDMMDLMDENTNLPEWVQSKITLAEDYISTAANYLRGELTEAVSPAQQAAIAINMKKRGVEPKVGKQPKGEYERKVDKYLKKKYQKEEVELQEGRPSQRHPLEGHEYHKKSDEALIHIAKDAHAAAEAMKGHNTQAENKYRDQANDSATVRHFRKKSGMPDWYKKKYGHMKEDVKVGDKVSFDHPMSAVPGKTIKKVGTVHKVDGDTAHVKVKDKYGVMTHKKSASELRKEEIEYLEEKNVPTSPEKWAQAKAQAKAKFDVYPSAYANGWAAKKYKAMGGGWKSVSEETSDEPSMAARTLSRKAQIVRDTVKSRKDEKDEASDKFQKDPELSSDIQKAP